VESAGRPVFTNIVVPPSGLRRRNRLRVCRSRAKAKATTRTTSAMTRLCTPTDGDGQTLWLVRVAMGLPATVIRLPHAFCVAAGLQRKRRHKSDAKHVLHETICSDSSLFKLSHSFCLFSPCQGQYQFVCLRPYSIPIPWSGLRRVTLTESQVALEAVRKRD
jgi:hypothetical protein